MALLTQYLHSITSNTMSDAGISNLTKRIFKGSSIILAFTLASAPIGYFIRMIFSRSLSIEDFGLVYAVLSLFTLLTMVNDLGFGNAVVYFVPKFLQKKQSNHVWLLYRYDQYIEVGTSIVICGLLLITKSFWVYEFFKHPAAEPLLYLFSIYLIGNGVISSIQKLLMGLQLESAYSLIEGARLLLTFLFSLFLYLYDVNSIVWFAASFSFGYIIVAFIYSLYIVRFKPKEFSFEFNRTLFKDAFFYAIPTLFSTSLFVLIHYSDMLFLTAFRSVEEVGLYNILFPIVSIATILLDPISKMIVPLVSELHIKNKFTELKFLVEQVLIFLPAFVLYISLYILIFPKGTLAILFGLKWVEVGADPLKLMVVGYLPMTTMMYLFSIVNGLGLVKERLRVSLWIAIASVIGGCIGSYSFGIYGIIVSNSLIYLLSTISLLHLIRKIIIFKLPVKRFIYLLLIAFMLVVARSQLSYVPDSFIELALMGILYTLVFALCMIFFGIITKHHIKHLRMLLS